MGQGKQELLCFLHVFGNCSRICAEQEGFNALLGIACVLFPERVRVNPSTVCSRRNSTLALPSPAAPSSFQNLQAPQGSGRGLGSCSLLRR